MAEELEELKNALMEVQNQLAFQEDTVQALNDAMAQQQQEILLLRRQLELLKQRQDEQAAAEQGEAAMPVEEKPPHY